jgi:phosphatidylinositol alpha-1,6-mannosyltransferase
MNNAAHPAAAGHRHARPYCLLLITPYYRPQNYGGAVRLYHELLMRLRSFRAVVVTERQGGNPDEMRKFDEACPTTYGYEVRRLRRIELHVPPGMVSRVYDATRYFIETRREWVQCLREVRPNVVVCGATRAAGWLMRQVPDPTPVVAYLHGEELADPLTSGRLRRYFCARQAEAIRHASLNIAASRYTADRACALPGVTRERVLVMPGSVDLERFSPPRDRTALRQHLRWEGRVVLLTIARLVPRKGIDQAIRALAGLQQVGQLPPNWLYVIGGCGGQAGELQRLSEELGLAEWVRFIGFVPEEELPSYYGAADVFLQPNRDIKGNTEGFGIVFLEANACGTPVIGGIAGGTGDAIQDEVSGFRVDGNDVADISRAIARLVQNPDLRSRIGRSGLEWVRRHFDGGVAAARFEDVLLRTCEGRHQPPPTEVMLSSSP